MEACLRVQDLHHDAMEMKHCYCVWQSEWRKYNSWVQLQSGGLFPSNATLNMSVRLAVLVEEEGQLGFSHHRDHLKVTSLVQQTSNWLSWPLIIDIIVKNGFSLLKTPKMLHHITLECPMGYDAIRRGCSKFSGNSSMGPNRVTCHGHFMTGWTKRALLTNWQRLVGVPFISRLRNPTSTMLFVDDRLVKGAGWGFKKNFYR